ncbi:MAG TPA: type IV toxin-antitoxin system AbiEi family antitoxin domain-containing protein, partial [Dermatophilaceae bacterium]|nr:type IV toxin-antitoxin system AbiEi family antitoxin domain-containing protein [Dermatophilaceae bacterium]
MDLDRVARSQHGVVSREQALEALTPEQLRWRLHRGDWAVVHPGVYRTHTGRLDWLGRASAALLRLGPGAALELGSAAHVLRFQDAAPPVIAVAVPHDRQRRRPPGTRVRRRRRLVTTTRRGLVVVTAAQTVLDLGDAPGATRQDAVSVAARAVQRRAVTVPALVEELEGRPAHQHRRAVSLALGVVALGAESGLEVDFHRNVLQRHGLAPMRMAVPDVAGERTIRRDFVDDEHGVVVEVDGRIAHGAAERAADARRDRRTARRGWVTLRAGWVDVEFEPCELALDVHGTRASRGDRRTIEPCGAPCAVHRAGRADDRTAG